MTAIVGVIASFFLMLKSDFLKAAGPRRWGNAVFIIALALLIASLSLAAAAGHWFTVAFPLRVLFILLAALAAWLEAVSLFWALPARETYLGGRETALVDRGMYALCRHPGALWLPLLLLSLALALGSAGLLWAGAVASVLNAVYVLIQDRWVFPKTIPGYAEYQTATPFLIPTRASLKRALDTTRHRQE
ncbi:MAG: methyltransferase [Eubacteriales bacterium]|nr:methyltransferase [Eubacteriales bacterium]